MFSPERPSVRARKKLLQADIRDIGEDVKADVSNLAPYKTKKDVAKSIGISRASFYRLISSENLFWKTGLTSKIVLRLMESEYVSDKTKAKIRSYVKRLMEGAYGDLSRPSKSREKLRDLIK